MNVFHRIIMFAEMVHHTSEVFGVVDVWPLGPCPKKGCFIR